MVLTLQEGLQVDAGKRTRLMAILVSICVVRAESQKCLVIDDRYRQWLPVRKAAG